MKYRLAYSPMALSDLDQVWLEVLEASQDIDTADEYIDGLKKAVRSKLPFPESGTPFNLLGQFAGIRYVRYKRYLAFYRLHNGAMEVGRILFEASDYIKTLFGVSLY